MVTVFLLTIGMSLAATQINEEDSIQFGVAILLLFRMVQTIQLLTRAIILCETYMINFERVNVIIQLPP